MFLIDFEYDGRMLSDFGFMICNITTNSGVETVSAGSNITWNTVTSNTTSKRRISSTQYDEVFSTTFEICKTLCDRSDNDTNYIQEQELREITMWLNRKKYLRFTPVFDDYEYSNIHYYGSFNIQFIKYGGRIIGLSLTLTTDAPFGYGEIEEYEFETTTSNNSFSIFDLSDEEGKLYLNAEIIPKQNGNLIIKNIYTNENYTIINNCISGEIITLDGENKIITSDKQNNIHKRIYNDFNYKWLYISNVDSFEAENVFTTSLPCKIKTTYEPIRKFGVV